MPGLHIHATPFFFLHYLIAPKNQNLLPLEVSWRGFHTLASSGTRTSELLLLSWDNGGWHLWSSSLTGLSQDAFRSLTWPPGNALSGNGRLSLSRLWCSCTSYGSSSSSGWGSEWFSLWRDLLSQWSHSRGDGCWDPATISHSVAESWKQMVTKSLLFF